MKEKEIVYSQEKKTAFEKLAFEYMDALYNSALRMTRNAEEAEDLVQDTYMRAYRFFDKFERGTNFKAWIFRILTNTFINNYRKKARIPQQVNFDKVAFLVEEKKTFQEEEILDVYKDGTYGDLFDDDVNRALDRLSEDFKQIIVLADVERLSYKEIAEKVQIPLGTVMSRLFRGRRMLQKSLHRYARRKGYIGDAAFV